MSGNRETEFARRFAAAARQEQFLTVMSREEAQAAFRAAVPHAALPAETVPLAQALGRVLARDIASPIDVPPFDRALVDGFALRAADTEGANPDRSRTLALNREILACGVAPALALTGGTATPIATGGVMPRGADAVIMVEQTEFLEEGLAIEVSAPVRPGQFVGYAGADMASGETVLRRLRGDPPGSGVLVVVVSADARAATAVRILAAGASHVLTKPLNLAELTWWLDVAAAAAAVSGRKEVS